MLAQLVAEEVDRIKKDASKAVKISKRSAEILSTSVCEKLVAIFNVLDADQDGFISVLDLEKSISGKLNKVFKPFVSAVALQPKPLDYHSFESSFRPFLRVAISNKNLSNEDRRLIINLGNSRSKSPLQQTVGGQDIKGRSKTPTKENVPKIDLKKLQQTSGKKVLSPLRERTLN